LRLSECNKSLFLLPNMSKIFTFAFSLNMNANPMRHIIAALTILLMAFAAGGQTSMTQITGLVRDSLTHAGIPYASVTLIGTDQGTMATAQGGFTINSRANFSQLRVSAVGYRSKLVPVRVGQGSVVIIDMSPSDVQLGEVIVRRGKERYDKNNPAAQLARRLREHRDDNDPLQRHDYYSYRKYEKMMFGFADLDAEAVALDSTAWANQYADTSQMTGKRILPISVRETVSETYLRRNPFSERHLITGMVNAGIDEQLDQASV